MLYPSVVPVFTVNSLLSGYRCRSFYHAATVKNYPNQNSDLIHFRIYIIIHSVEGEGLAEFAPGPRYGAGCFASCRDGGFGGGEFSINKPIHQDIKSITGSSVFSIINLLKVFPAIPAPSKRGRLMIVHFKKNGHHLI